jgi:IclR family transcriptional regulator, KDG regulon repressor
MPLPSGEKAWRGMVPSVEKALHILEFLASQRNGYTTSELSRKFKIPISTMNNLLYTLVHCGYLQRSEKGLFRVTMKLLGEAAKVMENTELREIAHEELERLTTRTALASVLSLRDGDQLVCIDKVEGPSQIRIASSIGKRFYLHSTCTGKAILAYASEEHVDLIVSEAGLPSLTPNTITSRPAFKKELQRIRSQGYAMDNEENTPGIRGISAVVFDHSGRVAGAVGVGGVDFQFRDRMKEIVTAVKDCARAISERLGFSDAGAKTRDLFYT